MKLLLAILIVFFLLTVFFIAVLCAVLSAENKSRKREQALGGESDEWIAYLQIRIKKTRIPAIKNALFLRLAKSYEGRGENKKALQMIRFVRSSTLFLDRSCYYTLLFALLSKTSEKEKAEALSEKYSRYIALK